MNILIFSANWYNRGDEAALRAMIDEILLKHPDWKLKIHFNQVVVDFPYSDIEVLQPFERLDGKNIVKSICYWLSIKSGGKLPYLGRNVGSYRAFVKAVKWADYAFYAPGGPCIGDLYKIRRTLLDILELLVRNKVPYSLFAPSVGPFSLDRQRVTDLLEQARVICLREDISKTYLADLIPNKHIEVTLDSAFQHSVNCSENAEKLENYRELDMFLKSHDKIIGVTITDLKWHRSYKDSNMELQIKSSFTKLVDYLISEGYGVVFIPQLFGTSNDMSYMAEFAVDNCFVMNDKEDTYFQQYIISKLFAVVGMRYHSNIFSAKMGVPFVSVAYEQKMKGFMEKTGFEEYCIDIKDLSFENLKVTFDRMIDRYYQYSIALKEKEEVFISESSKTLKLIGEDIVSIGNCSR